MNKEHVDKIKLKGMVKGSFYGIDKLTTDHGLKTNKVWFEKGKYICF